MKLSGVCPKCKSTEVIADVQTVDHGHMNSELELSLVTYKKPQAFLFKGRQATNLAAWVCGNCGYVELYADEPHKMRGPAFDES